MPILTFFAKGGIPRSYPASDGPNHVPPKVIRRLACKAYSILIAIMSYSDFLSNMDFYRAEYVQFQWDVHLLIEGTLDASTRYLQAEAKARLAKIEEVMHKPLDDEYYQHLEDEHGVVEARNSSQEQFLRNMALVALASRLTHALRKMARSAESFSERKKRYGGEGSEFDQLWREYTDRFGIDFKANAGRIAFVETLREVRNQIVHEGAEANTVKPLHKMDLNSGDAGYLDMWFSGKHPEYVSGTGIGAEVSVSEKRLEEHIKASVDLVGWLAGELRTRELASIGKAKDSQ